MGVPTIHRRLVGAPRAAAYDLRHMRLFTSGSDRLPDDLFQAFQATFGHTLLERYGMSETGMITSNPLHGERRVRSVGLPLPGVAVRIAHPQTDEPLPDGAVGEVQVRGANVCKGYWRQPDKTAVAFTPDGWLRTGDLGRLDADGRLWVTDRLKDLVISGGENVSAREVELVLASHPAVKSVAVVGTPDARWGEVVTAVVVAHPGRRGCRRAAGARPQLAGSVQGSQADRGGRGASPERHRQDRQDRPAVHPRPAIGQACQR